MDRVLTSMHVYLALTVFLERAAGADVPPGWADAAERSVQCRTRATWLCDAAQPHADHLTDSGRRFIADPLPAGRARGVLAEIFPAGLHVG